jgi:hypothetical protein
LAGPEAWRSLVGQALATARERVAVPVAVSLDVRGVASCDSARSVPCGVVGEQR